jgi:outer membrane protein TolC
LESSVTEQNLTRNLSAEGFNFPTGVPNFPIPAEVGPYYTFDLRLLLSWNLYDASAFRRARGLRDGLAAAKADVSVHRESSAAQVAHHYLEMLRADTAVEAASAGIAVAEPLLKIAEERESAGKAAAVEVTRAKLRLAADRRKLVSAEGDRDQARLQLLGDLGLDFNTPLELTDQLAFTPGVIPDAGAAVATAFKSRGELVAIQSREQEAHDNEQAIHLERLPSVSGYGDVGPLASVVTHTVGISVKVPIFDGGRRNARRAEALTAVHQQEIQQRDLRRQIELQVRKAAATLQSAAAEIEVCEGSLSLAQEELAEARRRFEGGVASNVDVVDAQAKLTQARADKIAVLYTWNLARVDLAQASGTMGSLELPGRGN